MLTRVLTSVSLLLALVAGLLAGVAGSFLQRTWPGLAVALALTVGAQWTSLERSGRPGAALSLAGWLMAVLPASVRRPEGDLVVVSDTRGYLWLVGGTVIGGLLIGLGPVVLGRVPTTSAHDVLAGRRSRERAATAPSPTDRELPGGH